MATITINGDDLQIGDQEKLNLIQAAQRVGVEIPHYCWHPALTVVASCRMCLVEVGEKKPDGTISMLPKLVPACQTPAKNNTVMVTNSKTVKTAQAATLEYLLLNHPLDCPTCDAAGECYLQDYTYRYGHAESRLKEPKLLRPDKSYIGEHITLFTDRCVMCSRCVRFTREISGTAELQVINRGSESEIDIFPGQPCNNKLAGNVVDLCPVGALCSKDFLYKQRVWWLRSQASVCPNCSTGCSIDVDFNENIVYRLQPRFNPEAQGHFMCDEGRFGFGYIRSENRLQEPMTGQRIASAKHGVGRRNAVEWDGMLAAVRGRLKLAAREPATLAAMFSPWMTCEEAYLLATLMKGLAPGVRLFMGPVPTVGTDDTYPKNSHGEPAAPVRFTIHAEKCPNHKGVAAVLEHFQGAVLGFEQLLAAIGQRSVKALYLVGGYIQPWITAEQAETLKALELLIVQDILASPASEIADYLLPGGSFAERDGTFVNHAGLAQGIKWAIRADSIARPDGRILLELLERPGLFHAASLRQEMAGVIPYFAPLETGDLGEFGVHLEQAPPNPVTTPAAAAVAK